jgi:hypothetical protein
MENEATSYIVLFCALLAAKVNHRTLLEAMAAAPLQGHALLLATELANQPASVPTISSSHRKTVGSLP